MLVLCNGEERTTYIYVFITLIIYSLVFIIINNKYNLKIIIQCSHTFKLFLSLLFVLRQYRLFVDKQSITYHYY
jgi:uncharacterized membrane protein YhaH (DUF805 family)